VRLTRSSIGKRPQLRTTIGTKLFLSFGTLTTITLLIALVGLVNDAILTKTVERVVFSTSVKQSLAGEIDLKFTELISLERGMNLRALMKDRATADSYNKSYLSDTDRLTLIMQRLAPLVQSDEDKQLCSEIRALSIQLRDLHDQAYLRVTGSAPVSSYSIYKDDFLPRAYQAKSLADRLLEDQAGLTRQDLLIAQATEIRSRWLTCSMLLLFCVTGAALSHIVIQINRNLRQIAAGLGKGAAQVATAAAQVASSSQSLAHGASAQAASIEETSASAEEINAMARRNAENAQATAGMVDESQRHIDEGNQSLDQMVAAMDSIALSSAQISKIVNLIDQIAFQTNILALNAAVEAARAGEAGMSFAVVAGEVRNLAQRSAQAAKDTAALVEDCISRSRAGKVKVDEVAAAIRSITAESSRVKVLVDEIHVGSREQSRGIEQVSKSVLQMEQVTLSTAAAADQSAAAAEELTAQFQSLRDLADDLSAMVGNAQSEGKNRQPAPRHSELRPAKMDPGNPDGSSLRLDMHDTEEEFQAF
jgi:methyl-accepting chemotaxis protein/methyl-accepting chemotaxis protein-1 (serine sensor receptor)